MKITDTTPEPQRTFNIELTARELRYLYHTVGATTSKSDEIAGFSEDEIGWPMYRAIQEALGENY